MLILMGASPPTSDSVRWRYSWAYELNGIEITADEAAVHFRQHQLITNAWCCWLVEAEECSARRRAVA